MDAAVIDSKVADMDRARAAKDYKAADAIRNEILAVREAMGPFEWRLVLSSGTAGTAWHWTMR